MAEKDRIRKRKIQVFLTEAEHQYLKDKSASCGLTMSEYFRKVMKDGLIVKLETYDIKELSKELNKIGTNLNQIAKHVNERGGDYDKQDMQNLIEIFRDIQQIVYAKALGMEI